MEFSLAAVQVLLMDPSSAETCASEAAHLCVCALQFARSSPHVACTLIEQHEALEPSANVALSIRPPDPHFQESYRKLLDSFEQGEERINGPAAPFGYTALRLRDHSLVLDGSYELELDIQPSDSLPAGCFAG